MQSVSSFPTALKSTALKFVSLVSLLCLLVDLVHAVASVEEGGV